jgi:type VI secretion system secreted protein Hcp
MGIQLNRAMPAARRAIANNQADYFLKIDGVEGESQDAKHKGEIDIASFDLGASQVGTGGVGSGSGAGKVKFEDMVFVMKVDKSSPVLMLACATGRHFAKATFVARKAGGNQLEYLTITLTDVLVSGFQMQDQGEGDPIPITVVTLNFAEIDVEYKAQTASGSLGPATSLGYNLKRNAKK